MRTASTVRAQKDLRVETARGLAVLLMVAGHVIGDSRDTGLQVEVGSGWRLFYDTMLFLRMPLFTVISGYVYSARPVCLDALGTFARGKTRRLVLPYLCVGGAFFLLQATVPGANTPTAMHEWWRPLLFPYAHFWYLQSLMLVFAVVAVLEVAGVLRSRWGLWIACALSFALPYSPLPRVELLGVRGAAYLLPFFLWGVVIERNRDVPESRAVTRALLALLVVAIGVRQLALADVLTLRTDSLAPITMLCALGTTLLVLRAGPIWTPLAKVGFYAYTIYLLHVFGTASARIVLQRADVQASWLHFVMGLGVGVLVPVVADRVCDRWAFTRLWVLGRAKPTASVPVDAPDRATQSSMRVA